MKQPEGFKMSNNANKVLKLKRAIYGLKQSSRIWYKKVEDVLTNLEYKKSKFEPYVFIKYNKSLMMVIALYVNYFFIFSNDTCESNALKEELAAKFKLKDLGHAKQILGMNICVNKAKKVIILDQRHYIDQLLSKFEMADCKTVDTPMEKGLNLLKTENCDSAPYQQLVGGLMYLAVMTRPDICYCVSYLSKFNNCHDSTHWKNVKRILRYLQKTKDLCINFKKSTQRLVGYVDATDVEVTVL